MSYEIQYGTFVVEKGGLFKPYVITGSNNCYMYYGGKEIRERDVYDISKHYGGDKYLTKPEAEALLGSVYDKVEGGYRNIQKTKGGFVKSFFKNVITEDELSDDGVWMEKKLKGNKPKQKRKTQYDYVLMAEDKPKTKLPSDDDELHKICDKRLVAYGSGGGVIGVGKIKWTSRGEFGFFPMNKRNTYYRIGQIWDYTFI